MGWGCWESDIAARANFPNNPCFCGVASSPFLSHPWGTSQSVPTQPPFLPTTPKIVTWKLKFPNLGKSVKVFPTQVPGLKNVTQKFLCDIFPYEKLWHKNNIPGFEKSVTFLFPKIFSVLQNVTQKTFYVTIFVWKKCHTKINFLDLKKSVTLFFQKNLKF